MLIYINIKKFGAKTPFCYYDVGCQSSHLYHDLI